MWETRLRVFQAAVGAFWASTAAAPSTASVVRRTCALPQSIALPGHLDEGRVCEEAIKDRGRGGDVAEEDPPILRRPIRGDERRRGFVPADKDFQEIFGRIRSELLHPKVFEHEQVDACELLHKSRRAPVASASAKSAARSKVAADARAVARPNGADGDRRGDVRLPDARRADEQHSGVGLDEARAD